MPDIVSPSTAQWPQDKSAGLTPVPVYPVDLGDGEIGFTETIEESNVVLTPDYLGRLYTRADMSAPAATLHRLGESMLFTSIPPAPDLVSIEVSPASAGLGEGETEQFTAVGTDSYGGEYPVEPVWSVDE